MRSTASVAPRTRRVSESPSFAARSSSLFPIEQPDEHDLFQLWKHAISRRCYLPHQLLVSPCETHDRRRVLRLFLFLLSVFPFPLSSLTLCSRSQRAMSISTTAPSRSPGRTIATRRKVALRRSYRCPRRCGPGSSTRSSTRQVPCSSPLPTGRSGGARPTRRRSSATRSRAQASRRAGSTAAAGAARRSGIRTASSVIARVA